MTKEQKEFADKGVIFVSGVAATLLFLLGAGVFHSSPRSAPADEYKAKFAFRDKVKYLVPHLYSKICDGFGEVRAYDISDGTYQIVDQNPECYLTPSLRVEERNMLLVEGTTK